LIAINDFNKWLIFNNLFFLISKLLIKSILLSINLILSWVEPGQNDFHSSLTLVNTAASIAVTSK